MEKENEMTHFAVMVFGDNVEEQLQPYHEFECTGTDDEYVQDIDKTTELLERYQKSTVTKMKDKNGNYFYPWDDMFYREPTEEEIEKYGLNYAGGTRFGGEINYKCKDWGDGKGYRVKISYLPDGYEEVEVKESDLVSFAKYCEEDCYPIVKFDEVLDLEDKHKYGYTQLNENGEVVKVIKRTNPNKTWDYWTVGGRYSGLLKLKEPNNEGEYNVDEALKKDINFEVKDEALIPYAFVKDGKWFGKGTMGWWCISVDEDVDEYNNAFKKALEEATDDTLITIVDCHI